MKAKWIRVELRKVEILPSQAGTFYDFVGQSPINVWQAKEEWATLENVRSIITKSCIASCFMPHLQQDFPFNIRIPESIPPSLLLEKGSGIQYELVASVCIKGKKYVCVTLIVGSSLKSVLSEAS